MAGLFQSLHLNDHCHHTCNSYEDCEAEAHQEDHED